MDPVGLGERVWLADREPVGAVDADAHQLTLCVRDLLLIVGALGEHEEPLRYNQLSREMPGSARR